MATQTASERFWANPDDPRHGTANGYHNLRCRCPRCRKAWTDYKTPKLMELRRRRGVLPVEEYRAQQRSRLKHGTRSMYVKGCHCEKCRAATLAYAREYRRRKRHQHAKKGTA